MILRATVRDKQNGDFLRTVDVLTADDFGKVGAAAASWARQRAKGVQLYGSPVRRELVLQLEWVQPAPPNGPRPAPRAHRPEPKSKRRK
jgi:hypothetical protein